MSLLIEPDKLLLNFNSNQRIAGEINDFTADLKDVDVNAYNRISLVSCNIPKSYYLMDGVDYFVLHESTGSASANITIPQGNYTRKGLSAELKNELDKDSPNGWTYTITYDSPSAGVDNGKYYFSVSGNSGGTFYFEFLGNTSRFSAQAMGFDRDESTTPTASTLTSSRVINLQRAEYLFIGCNAVGTITSQVQILHHIGATGTTQFSHINHENEQIFNSGQVFNKQKLIKFTLFDEEYTKINTNGINWSITILLYREESLSKKLNALGKLISLSIESSI